MNTFGHHADEGKEYMKRDENLGDDGDEPQESTAPQEANNVQQQMQQLRTNISSFFTALGKKME